MKKERHTDPTEYSLHLFQIIEINFSQNVKLRFKKNRKGMVAHERLTEPRVTIE